MDKIVPATALPGSYASLNGLELYYEIHGSGEPLILLHGGVGGSAMFAALLPAFAAQRQVITVDLQAHGHTANIDRPLDYELMAQDIAGLMTHLKLASADLLGYSLGGGVALRTAIQFPALVRRLVLVSTTCKHDGWYPEVLSGFEQMGPQAAAGIKNSPLAQLYPSVDWGNLFSKIHDLQVRDYNWSAAVAQIAAPTMLVFADADAIRLEHITELYELLGGGRRDAGLDGSARPNAQLAVLPGCTHYNILGSPLFTAAVAAFLENPVGRATQ